MGQSHSMEEVRRVKRDVESDLLSRPGVSGVDVGYKQTAGQQTHEPAIVVYVQKKGDVPADQAIPREIQGVPTDVVEKTFELH